MLRLLVQRAVKTVTVIQFSESWDKISKKYGRWTLEAFLGPCCRLVKDPPLHLNSLKINTQIVHLVALDELYKIAYLD